MSVFGFTCCKLPFKRIFDGCFDQLFVLRSRALRDEIYGNDFALLTDAYLQFYGSLFVQIGLYFFHFEEPRMDVRFR